MSNDSPVTTGGETQVVLDPPVLRLATKEKDQNELHRLSFAGHLLAEEDNIKSGIVYSILKSAWRPKGGLEVHEQSKNTFIFILSDEQEKERIFRESPWFVKGSHIVLKEWPDSQRFDEIAFSHSAFWVQVHGLPKGCMTPENIQLIGSLFPRLISWDKSTLGGLESFLRLRVAIDVHSPLLTSFQFRIQGDEICSAEFKYEKLVDFCYQCGMLGHTNKFCNDFRRTAEDGNDVTQPKPQYGPHLRAPAYSPRKHFGSIRAAKHVTQSNDVYPIKPAQLRHAAKETLPDTPTNAEQRKFQDVASFAEPRVSTDAGRRVNLLFSQTPPNALIEANPSSRDMITTPDGSSISSLSPTVTPGQKSPPLNAMETNATACPFDLPPEPSSNLDSVPEPQYYACPL
ncbi:hypothetical protein SLA2020_476090 [Shorea laevis]